MKMEVSVYNMKLSNLTKKDTLGRICIILDLEKPFQYNDIEYNYIYFFIGCNQYNEIEIIYDDGGKYISKEEAFDIVNNIYNNLDKFMLVKPSSHRYVPEDVHRLTISNIEDESLKNELIHDIKIALIEYNM